MIEIIDLLTFFLSTYWLVTNVKNIGRSSKFIIGLLVYVFYVLPIGMDWLYKMADYTYFPDRYGFIWPRKDFLTNLIYDCLVLVTLYAILLKNSIQNTKIVKPIGSHNKIVQIILYVGMVFPAIATIVLLKEPNMLFAFQWREMHLFSDEGTYHTIERFTYIGISCSILLLFSKRKKNFIVTFFLKAMCVLFIFMNVCIQGKRAILFYAIINLMLMLYFKLEEWKKDGKNITNRVLLMSVLASLGLYFMISFTSFVKAERGYEQGTDKMYVITRIDMLRDDRVRMAIYYDLYSRFEPELPSIVSYPGQTFLVDFTSFIPLNYLVESFGLRDAPYQTRFTHALLKMDPSKHIDKEHNGMTVSFLAEIISNLGILLAFFIIPIFCNWSSKMIDKYAYPNNALILCCFVLLQLFDFTYVSVFIELTIILCFLTRKGVIRKKNNTNKKIVAV